MSEDLSWAKKIKKKGYLSLKDLDCFYYFLAQHEQRSKSLTFLLIIYVYKCCQRNSSSCNLLAKDFLHKKN